MDNELFYVKRCKANDLECILLSSLLCIPNDIMFHPKFRELVIVRNSIAGKTRLCKGKIKRVRHYCSITIDDNIESMVSLVKNNPFFMDYKIYERRQALKKTKRKVVTNSGQILFWLPTDKQREEYE